MSFGVDERCSVGTGQNEGLPRSFGDILWAEYNYCPGGSENREQFEIGRTALRLLFRAGGVPLNAISTVYADNLPTRFVVSGAGLLVPDVHIDILLSSIYDVEALGPLLMPRSTRQLEEDISVARGYLSAKSIANEYALRRRQEQEQLR
jgi:hypothetical protein